jgi:Na+-driven multidrug efflux pump
VQVFGELSPRQKRIEVVRWLLLVPAAWLASSIVTFIIGAFLRVIRSSSVPLNSSSISFWASAVLSYVLPDIVFVIVGAWIAPRKQLPVALLLMLLGGVLSLMMHVVLQHLAGNRVGPTNYTHFGLEMAGLLVGVVCIRLKIVPRGTERQ